MFPASALPEFARKHSLQQRSRAPGTTSGTPKQPLLFRHLRLINKQNRDAVANRVHAAAAGAAKRALVGGEGEWLPAFRDGTDEDIK